MVMLEVAALVKRYPGVLDQKAAVREVSFEVEEGEFFTLLGPSGCGKTTTLRSVAGLETPDEGRIEIDGHRVFSSADRTSVAAHRRPLSMVFQSYAVWPHLTVVQNVMYPLTSERVRKGEAHRRAMEALEVVGLTDVAERMPGAISGGQQQRVALARAVVRSSKLLLLDEPLSNLDAKLRVQMREEIKSLQRHFGATVLYVTHDQEEAMMLSDRIAVMNSGVVVEMGKPADLYSVPHELFTARFMGENNLIPVTLREKDSSGAVVDASFGAVRTTHFFPGDGSKHSYYLLLRPEAIQMRLDDRPADPIGTNQFRGTIVDVIYLGKFSQYRVDTGGFVVTVQSMGGRPLPTGSRVRGEIPDQGCGVYAAAPGLAGTKDRDVIEIAADIEVEDAFGERV